MKISDLIDDIKTPGYEITSENYENIFNVYDDNGQPFYNLIRSVNFPEDLDPTVYTLHTALPNEHYTTISYNYYGTTKLWWVICGANQILDPTYPPYTGRQLRIIKPEYISEILGSLNG